MLPGGGRWFVSRKLLSHRSINLDDMVRMKLNSHSTLNLIGAIWIIVKDSDIGFRLSLCDSNPHSLDVSFRTGLDAENELRQISWSQRLPL
jgi:hypothetical protein